MKTQYLLIPMLLLSACRTTAGTKDKPKAARTYSGQSEKLLQKRVGALDIEKKDQVYDCVIMSADLPNADEIRKLIAQVPRGKIENIAFHFRAQEPSLEIYAYDGGEGDPIVLHKDHSIRELRDDDASKKLIDLVNQRCPGKS